VGTWRAETARPHHEHLGVFQALLTCTADFLQKNVAAVPLNFIFRKGKHVITPLSGLQTASSLASRSDHNPVRNYALRTIIAHSFSANVSTASTSFPSFFMLCGTFLTAGS